jgi:hypothetical protein
MRTELELVIIAIMLIVAALVVLTIFGGGMSQFGNLANAKANCINSGKTSCETTGMTPFNWNTKNIQKPDGGYTSCSELVGDWANCCQGTGPSNTAPYRWEC